MKDAHLAAKNLDDRGRPFAPVETLALRFLRHGIHVRHLARRLVRAEDVDGLSKLLRLEDDALHDLRVGVHIERGEVRRRVRLVLEILLQRVHRLYRWRQCRDRIDKGYATYCLVRGGFLVLQVLIERFPDRREAVTELVLLQQRDIDLTNVLIA